MHWIFLENKKHKGCSTTSASSTTPPLLCPQWMSLLVFILAPTFTQDHCYFNTALSEIVEMPSELSFKINKNENNS
jgi:hypothetical protein